MSRKITFEEAQKRFAEQGREDICICEDDYKGWKIKSKFWDNIEKDYFLSVPYKVWKEKIVHPNRRIKKREETFIKRFGARHPSLNKEIAKKISESHLKNFADEEKAKQIKENRKQGCLKKYGVDNPSKAPEVRKKIEKTNLERFGTTTPASSKIIKDKTKKTNMEKYGVDNPMKNKIVQEKLKQVINKKYGVDYTWQSPDVIKKSKNTIRKKYNTEHPSLNKEVAKKISESHLKNFADPVISNKIKNKRKATCVERYGANSPLEVDVIKDKIKKTMKERYGGEHPSYLLQKFFILETEESLSQWYMKDKRNKPSLLTIERFFNVEKKTHISIVELEKIIEDYKEKKTSLEVLSENLFKTEHYNKKPKQISTYYRPDFKLGPRIFVNVDGLYWHSEHQKDKWYHFNLRKEFEENNLRIFQFREDEIKNKPQIVRSIINNSLGKTQNKIFARKCTIKIISQKEAEQFLNGNHLMSSTNAKHIGLYFKEQLISILSYKCRKNVCKIERFCSKIDTNIVGGFSKLLNHLEKEILEEQISEIHNWVDLRYGTGNHLQVKGFILIRETLGWKWTDSINAFNRLKCRANMDERGLSEQEHANELKWCKIYDAGQRLWIKTLY